MATGGSFVGTEIFIDGLSALQIDALIQVKLADGICHSTMVHPKDPTWKVPERETAFGVFSSYATLGTKHIFGAYDHLLFVLALLLSSDRWMRVKAVTAFTLGHSATPALATLDFVSVPSAPTEAVISLSIVFLASEIIRKHHGSATITTRPPWLIAAGFGLVHGLGVVGALTEIGLPQHAVPFALFAFNLGVEFDQIAFVLGVFATMTLGRFVAVRLPSNSWMVGPYAIGSIAAFWTIWRIINIV